MKMIIALIIIFTLALLCDFANNLTAYFKLKKYKKLYEGWHKNPKSVDFAPYSVLIVNLLKGAGISNGVIEDIVQPSEKYFKRRKISVYDNLCMRYDRIYDAVIDKMNSALAIYLDRAKNAICPIHWLNLIVFAPVHLLNAICRDTGKDSSKLLSYLLTFLWWLFCAFFALFENEIKLFIIYLLEVYL